MKDIVEYLSNFTMPERMQLFENLVKDRTNYIKMVIEDLYQPHNISAVLRSCDCFGVQNIHVIENRNEYETNMDIDMGSSKWVNVIRHNGEANNTRSALRQLKSEGYRIVATSPHTNDVLLNDFDVTKGKFAFVFGNEKDGISNIVREEADEFVRIPMYGFTESFNISVSAALCLQYATNEIRKQNAPWQLTEIEHYDILHTWLCRSIRNAEMLEAHYYLMRNEELIIKNEE